MKIRAGWFLLFGAFVLLLAACDMSSAPEVVPSLETQVKFGSPDNGEHPYVGLLVFDVDGSPAWRCTGTLLSPTVLLTAGHCTYGADGGRVWFDEDVTSGRPDNGYPFAGKSSIEFAEIYTHPDYDDSAFYLNDVGIVILAEPVDLDPAQYGSLPEVGVLDPLATQRGLQDQSFEVVGYGRQSVKPRPSSLLIRLKATVQLITIKGNAGIPEGISFLFTNAPGKGTGGGGTCFGDSGGPIFLGDSTTIVGVTSFALNSNCTGAGGGYRIDTANDLEFITQFLN